MEDAAEAKETLDEFTCKFKKLVDKWNEDWRVRNSADPVAYPMEMDAGQWYEQLLIYFATEDGH